MWKSRLFTPGPAEVPPRVLLEMAGPLIHHRTPQFREILGRCFTGLKEVFQTGKDVYILTSSGSGAMEAAVVNLLSPGEKCLVVDGGKFGERFFRIARAWGIEADRLELEWGRSVDPEMIRERLESAPGTKVVFMTLCETSTGAHNDPRAVSEMLARSFPETLLVVDGVSGVGAVECRMDEWGIDALVSGSQKGLMLPPGLSFIALSERAWKAVEQSTSPRFYHDLRAYRKSLQDCDTPWTSALSLIIGLDRSLSLILEEGLDNVWRRHDLAAGATRAAGTALGLEVFPEKPSSVLTVFRLPEGLDGEKITRSLRDGYGVTFAGGQGKLKGRLIRVAHIGWLDRIDTLGAVAALEYQLRSEGFSFTPGSGVAAAQGHFLEAAQ